ncbi:MAG: sigma-54 dependent transcriptional regulator [Acidobacteriota bacterium]
MKALLNALVIDDDVQVSGFVAQVLRSDGWEVQESQSAEQAFDLLQKKPWSLVFCDVVLGGTDGYQVLRRFQEVRPEAAFVLMTGYGSAAGAMDATAIGAYDYLIKPFTIDDLLHVTKLVREQNKPSSAKERSEEKLSTAGYTSDIPLIGKSPKFVNCMKMVGRVAPTDLPILISGESGTGKEVVAKAIHQRSTRKSGPFITVNCAAIPVDLIESELFGHAKGSFTGADRERAGLWEEADGGTIFLDEITETTAMFQVKLLRVLQESEIRRVGSNKTIKVDVRVIAATNRGIETEVSEGRFRQDLMYRLNAVTIQLPPLRERVEDILTLAQHFAKQVRLADARAIKFSTETVETLRGYPWPGNVRELENAVLHAVSLCEDVVQPRHLPDRMRSTERDAMTDIGGADESPKTNADWISLSEMEGRYVAQVLDHTGGNKQAAARLLDIDRKTLSRILERNSPEK